MLRGLLAACALLCAATAARASAYDDFSIGIGAFGRGDADLAIASLTKAIAAGDLAPNLLPTAYLDRGICYLQHGLYDSAIADLQMAAKLDPKVPEVYSALGTIHERQGDFAQAVADYTQFVVFAADQSSALWLRSRANWEAGHFADALADVEKALAKTRHPTGYAFLWARMASAEAHVAISKDLADKEDDADLGKWPGQVLALYRGGVTEDFVRNSAKQGDVTVQNGQLCEADFYIAELKRERSDLASAQAGFAAAAKECPPDFVESPAAKAGLKQMEGAGYSTTAVKP